MMDGSAGRARESGAPCMFWNLPLEVRDMIYELVYGDRRAIKVKSRTTWARDEKSRRRSDTRDFKPKTFPESHFSGMLVSKLYLEEAAMVYVRSKTFVFYMSPELYRVICWGSGLDRQLLTSMTSVVLEHAHEECVKPLGMLPRLRVLELGLNHSDLEIEDKFPWIDDYSDLELANTAMIGGLLRLRGLHRVKVIQSKSLQAKTPEEHRKWGQILSQAERLLSKAITRPWEVQHIAADLPNFGEIRPPSSDSGSSSTNVKLESLEKLFSYTRSPATIQTPGIEAAAKKASSTPLEDVLTAEDIPETETGFAWLCYSRSHALFKWVQDAKKRLNNFA